MSTTDPVEVLLQGMVAQAVTNLLLAYTPPNESFNGPNFPRATGGVRGYSCSISGGSVTAASTTLTDLIETVAVTGGSTNVSYAVSYTCTFTSSLSIAYSSWSESYTLIMPPFPPEQMSGTWGGFTCTIGTLTVSFTLAVPGSTASVTGGSAQPTNISFSLPGKSVLNGNYSCVQDHINSQVQSEIANVDFFTPIENAINNALSG